VYKTVTRGCKLWPSKRRLEESLESKSIKTYCVIVPSIIYYIVPHTQDFIPIKFFALFCLFVWIFFKYFIFKLCSRLGPLYPFWEHGDLSISSYFSKQYLVGTSEKIKKIVGQLLSVWGITLLTYQEWNETTRDVTRSHTFSRACICFEFWLVDKIVCVLCDWPNCFGWQRAKESCH